MSTKSEIADERVLSFKEKIRTINFNSSTFRVKERIDPCPMDAGLIDTQRQIDDCKYKLSQVPDLPAGMTDDLATRFFAGT